MTAFKTQPVKPNNRLFLKKKKRLTGNILANKDADKQIEPDFFKRAHRMDS